MINLLHPERRRADRQRRANPAQAEDAKDFIVWIVPEGERLAPGSGAERGLGLVATSECHEEEHDCDVGSCVVDCAGGVGDDDTCGFGVLGGRERREGGGGGAYRVGCRGRCRFGRSRHRYGR